MIFTYIFIVYLSFVLVSLIQYYQGLNRDNTIAIYLAWVFLCVLLYFVMCFGKSDKYYNDKKKQRQKVKKEKEEAYKKELERQRILNSSYSTLKRPTNINTSKQISTDNSLRKEDGIIYSFFKFMNDTSNEIEERRKQAYRENAPLDEKKMSKELKEAKQMFWDNYGYGRSSDDAWDDFYELKKVVKKEFDKGNITRKQYNKIMEEAEDVCH